MNPQEAELGQELSEDMEADLPPPQRRRHDNNTGTNNRRPRQPSNHSSENNNHNHAAPRYRRYNEAPGAGGSRIRGAPQRRSTEEPEAELHQGAQSTPQQPQPQPQPQPQQAQGQSQPIPRPAVTRYRRQGDSEAKLRAQQQRHTQRQQREAERAQQQQLTPPAPQPVHTLPPQRDEPEEAEGEREGEKERVREGDDSALACSASRESGFHTHTDQAEGDAVMALDPEAEDKGGTYMVTLRPEAEGYTESAESEQQHIHPHPNLNLNYPPQPPPLPREPLPDIGRVPSQEEAEEALNPGGYSNYVYTQPLYHRGGGSSGTGGRDSSVEEGVEPEDEAYSEAYDYSLTEHVYEEIGDAPSPSAKGAEPTDANENLQQRKAGFRLFEGRDGGGDYRQQEAVGSRLHHYDERSDGESDSPEKEAEFAPYPRADSCDQDGEEDIDMIVAEVRESLSSQSLERAVAELGEGGEDEDMMEGGEEEEGEWPESEHAHNSQSDPPTDSTYPKGEIEGQGDESEGESIPPPADSPSEDWSGVRNSREKRDAISLAIKDIKEAIEEVKTRTVRSPYTPDEPKEPIWVMRQDLSPTTECCDLQPSLGGDSPGSDSQASPQGAGSSIRTPMLEGSDSFESPPPSTKESRRNLASFPTYVEVPGPCDPEDLIDGIIFAANYLGSTQLLSDKTPSKNVRMMQAQEAVSHIKQTPEGEAQPMTEVDLFISTQRIKVLNADSQETMMDHPLRTISYIADIGNIVVLMARRRIMPRPDSTDSVEVSEPDQEEKQSQYKMICHIFESEDAQLIAQSIGQAFSVAYQEFLRANGINPEDLSQKEYSDLLNTQDMYNDDLIHFSKSENCKDVYIEKQKGEILGVVIVESGWGSILPTVIIANMMHAGPSEKSGRLNIGDQIMSINGTSLVGLPLSTCQTIIKGLKNQSCIKLNIVRCPPVTTVLIRRPDLRYQLGFSVQNGIICSLMRGGIAERGGVRVGHRIIEINSQSVVATPHEKIVHILSNAVGEIHMKTMPAAMYRLLTAQEQPVYI
ncbi:amyloid-beta A4 precursor protein-binding family A member 1-like isoform X1 [Coregonus clupeaformis]|uniref:amyloid-beta A4 precursor protein-binding family A member 1-like isoform X1 n=1 Tax=Coregonus clupeaformis TaxID=59861 RepID=UPI001BE0958C|nr:amyloid-beta A4 precursor protein-binding family A member 1-like isoform X1 [Coregonus clupeaformis]XP_041691837.1 amyloid-beta A4 precursor protein-binding family A member 1-like isoform X1 [Coregonus clupeaformis]